MLIWSLVTNNTHARVVGHQFKQTYTCTSQMVKVTIEGGLHVPARAQSQRERTLERRRLTNGNCGP